MGKRGPEKTKIAFDNFVAKARKIHGDKYKYRFEDFQTTMIKMAIECPDHGIWMQTPSNHIHIRGGKGCPHCSRARIARVLSLTTDEFLTKAINKHGNKYSYEKTVYFNSKTLVTITCFHHGDFKQAPYNHLECTTACPKCVGTTSQAETDWLNSLNIPEDCRQKRIRTHRSISVDAFVPETNTVYMFHGTYWHGDPRFYEPWEVSPNKKILFSDLYKATIDKENEIRAAGYNLIVIWEEDWKKQNGETISSVDKWWDNILTHKSRLYDWLRIQYKKQISLNNQYYIGLIKTLLESRNINLDIKLEVPKFYHLSIEKKEVVLNHPKTPEDIRATFKEIFSEYLEQLEKAS